MKSSRLFPCIGLAAAVLMPGIGSLHASLITFHTFDANGTSAFSNVGTFSVTESGGGATSPNTYAFTHTGNLDGGTVNDTLSFDFVYTIYTGSTFDGTNVTLGSPVNYDSSTGNQHFMNDYVGDSDTNGLVAGDSFTVSITNISYTSGEGYISPAVAFDGFNSITKFGAGSGDVYIGTTSAVTKTVASATGTTITLDGVTELAMTASTTEFQGQRWRDLNFSFTVPDAAAVPEASESLIFVLGMSGLLAGRRRSRGRP